MNFVKGCSRRPRPVANNAADCDSEKVAVIDRYSAGMQIREHHQRAGDWGVSDLEAYTWFMTDVEWSWMSGSAPIEDW